MDTIVVLPSGFALPPLPHLLAVAALAAAVLVGLRRDPPTVDGRAVLALAPWMVAGSSLYACHQLGLYPSAVAPVFGSPIVYATTAAAAGATWLAVRRFGARPRALLAGVGAVAAAVPITAALARGWTAGTLTLAWPLGAVGAALVLTAGSWRLLARIRPTDTRAVGAAGVLAVFGHALDATSTAVGVDALGYGEQTPLSTAIIELARALPTAPVVGGGWLFVVVKLALAAGVVVLLAESVRDRPQEGTAILGLVAAVGLGPGVHNVVLFIAANPTGF
ncbi:MULTISPECIES: DUF63 family protein [Halobacterium]|uniref:DUF63 family protein n=1 Tax=Halobacterium TaxID=2239 RepID=UPI0019668909|nr:DUF63 family protein [Halobacterium sp. GSL-19]QRY22117.1 DUF63 family protein [Halobacterium sp. GSL-19]WJK63498.1 DUF63 family protein [Halobacterium salinarum]